MWSLRSSTDDPFDTFLVVSFISETRILAMNLEDELEETEIEGFCSQVQTLFCHDAVHNQLVQVGSGLILLLWWFSSFLVDLTPASFCLHLRKMDFYKDIHGYRNVLSYGFTIKFYY